MERKTISTIFLIIATLIIVGAMFFTVINLNQEKNKNKTLLLLGNLKFSGRVINSKVYDYGGRPYLLVCLRLNNCNKRSFYIFNELCAMKIKDSIATMSAGGANFISPVTYVEIDAKKNTMTYHYQNATADTSEIDLRRNGLTENQINSCK